jgi:hypothetical protein
MEAEARSQAARPQRMNAPTRELAQRLSGTAEILLLWHPASDRVELLIRDLASASDLHVDVAHARRSMPSITLTPTRMGEEPNHASPPAWAARSFPRDFSRRETRRRQNWNS